MSFHVKKKLFNTDTTPPPVPGSDLVNDNKNEESACVLKEEALLWLFSILGALLVYLLVASIAQAVYHPDINLMKEKANQFLVMPSLALPKPMEVLLFRLSIGTIIPALYGFYLLFSKMKWVRRLARKPFFLFFSIACIVALIALVYFDFAAENPPGGTGKRMPPMDAGVENSNFNFFFNGFFIGNYLWLYVLAVVPLVTGLFFIGIKKYDWENKKIFKITVPILGYAVIGAVVVAIVAMNTFVFPYANDNKYDFNAVYYSMTQVYAGVPMQVCGFTNTYGLYPHFLNPLFQLTGLNVLKFSMTLSLLLGLSFVMNFYSLKKFVSNQVILFLGFATMLFFSYLLRKLTNEFDCYFALFPIRYIIPSTLLFLATLHFTKPLVKLYWITFFVMAFFVLWNPEIGVVCYISWIAVNVYNDFYSGDGKINIKKILSHIATGIGVLFIAFYTYKGAIWIGYGSLPELGMLWKATFIFSSTGFMCLPMTLVNPWNLFALVLVSGFLYSIVKWSKKTVTPKASIIFLVSLIGLGYFFYYECRSHTDTLLSSCGFCILLLTILGDELWQAIKDKNIFSLNALFVVFLFLISFSFIELGFNAGRIYAAVEQEDDKQVSVQERELMENDRDFILKNTQEKEKILLMTISKFHGLLFDGYKRVSAFNPGFIDMLLKSDLDRFQDMIRDSSLNIFIEPQLYNYPFMQYSVAEVGALYDYKGAGETMAFVKKRKTHVPALQFFNNTDQLVIHRKYNDDTAGLRARINDAFGIKPITLAPEFSVQILFYSRPQIYQYAVLAGNTNEPKGFAICNELNTFKYFFLINGKGVSVPMRYNMWMYCVMNVYPDSMNVYVNGVLSGSAHLPQPILRSDEDLCIGNLGNMHYYVGAISEVAIQNKALSQDQLQETWKQIEQNVGK